MIIIKDKFAQEKMATAGKLLSSIFLELQSHVVHGVSTLKLDGIIEQMLKQKKLVSQTKGYMGYRHVSCISLNEEVVHGIPHQNKILKQGDLVKIDVCASWNGYCADMARCFFVGEVSPNIKQLVDAAWQALDNGIAKALTGNRVGAIGAAVQEVVENAGFGVVRDFAGHGIGKRMHEEPEILNYGKSDQGPILSAGMALAIEPMLTFGHYDVCVMSDGWTVKTADNSLAAHVEDTVIITEDGPNIITRLA